MPFPTLTPNRYPPRLWALAGYPNSGKSWFAAQMRGPLLAIDADHRFVEVVPLAADPVHYLSSDPRDHFDTDRIATILAKNMPGAAIATIVVDSLTAVLSPVITRAMQDKEYGREKNLAAAWRRKALAMRQLQDAVTCWGTDVLWIYHLVEAGDARGNMRERTTIPQTELARLERSINLKLETVKKGPLYGVTVTWARDGRSGVTLWDDTGRWAGMPARIEAAVYDSRGSDVPEGRDDEGLDVFASREAAIEWGYAQGAFPTVEEARETYERIKQERDPRSAREMAALWKAEVRGKPPLGSTS
jgi:hypothetical protein